MLRVADSVTDCVWLANTTGGRRAAPRKSGQRLDDRCAGGLCKYPWKAVSIRYQQSKKLDPHQRFSLRIGYEETIHSFLYDVGRACSGLLRSGQSGKAS